MDFKFDPNELTEEKSLWKIYLNCRKLKLNKFNVAVGIISFLLFIANTFSPKMNTEFMLKEIQKWATFGLSFSVSTLGILLAGFTIFASLSKPKMLLAMMDHTDKSTGLKTLKMNFYPFILVFIVYLFFSFLYLAIMILGTSNGIISYLLDLIPKCYKVKEVLLTVSYAFTGTSFVYLLIMLKSFIFNIYAVVMNFLRWEHLSLTTIEKDHTE